MGLLEILGLKPKQCTKGHILEKKFKFRCTTIQPGKSTFGVQSELYCKRHFLEKIFQALTDYQHPFIFSEPLDYKNNVVNISQTVFYTVSDLQVHNFSPEDQDEVRKLLDKASEEKPVIWLPKEVIAEVTSPPLLKIKDNFVLLTKEEFLSKIQESFAQYNEDQSGEFEMNLPYGTSGIYVYHNYL